MGSGALPADPDRAGARGETRCSLEEVCRAAAWLCRTGGGVFFVHKPERLSELLCGMTACGIEPKRLRPVCKRLDSAPSLVLVEGRRGGRPGLRIEPALPMQKPDGSPSVELRRICHLEEKAEKP